MSSRLSKVLTAVVVATAVLGVELMRRRLGEQHVISRNQLKPPQEDSSPTGVVAPDLETATRKDLYREAQRLGIRGRSKMTKVQLKAALSEGAGA
jgi:hypothetical protein